MELSVFQQSKLNNLNLGPSKLSVKFGTIKF